MTEISNAAELREVYLMAFDNMSVDPVTVEQETDGRIGSRFARELIGTLANSNLLGENEVEGETLWQTSFSVDDTEREEVEAFIDEFLGLKKAKPAKKATATSGKSTAKHEGYHPCGCGCEENVPAKSNYRPGHDARHAGQVGREIAVNYATPGFDRRELLAALPSDALKDKAEAIAEKAIERAAKKADKPVMTEGTAKVGKNTVKARMTNDGIEVLDGAEWKPASKSAAKTFTPA